MSIRGVTVTGKKIDMRFMTGPKKEVLYITGFEEMIVDSGLGSHIITAKEILMYIQARQTKEDKG